MTETKRLIESASLPSKQRVARSSRAGTTNLPSQVAEVTSDSVAIASPPASLTLCQLANSVQIQSKPADAIVVVLNRGRHALVSYEDYERIAALHWSVKTDRWGCEYARAHVPGSGKRGKCITMHRFILDAKKGQIVDHRDGNGLNNTRQNLRLCTTAENIRNQKAHQTRKAHSRLKGVYRLPDGRWRAQIMVQYKKKNLGTFPDEIAAARAYDAAAKDLHGAFARLNFPEAA